MSASCRVRHLDCRRDRTPNGASNWQTNTVRVSSNYSRSTNVVRYPRLVQTIGAVSEGTELANLTKDVGGEKFDWFKNWWPVQAVENLPTDRPYRIQLLGKYYVVWKGHSGNWIAMDDECPHRLAPLSEGRIEKDGNLLCSYHAWRFNESGKCVKIPHAENEKAHFVACNSPRSAVQTYPCKTRGSLLWIWPDKSVSALTASEKVLLPIDDDIADSLERAAAEGAYYNYFRYMPYGFDVLMENLCDPSHVPVSHHGVVPGWDRYNAKPLEATLTKEIVRGCESVAFRFKPFSPIVDSSQFELRKPGFGVVTDMKKDETVPYFKLIFAAYPTCVGRSACTIAAMSQRRLSRTKSSTLLQKLLDRLESFISNAVIQAAISDGDSVFLHEQDKRIRERGPGFSARKEYFVPTSADLLVMHFRKWFEEEAGSGAAYGNTKIQPHGPALTKEQVLDRYEQHTKHSKGSQETLKWVESCIKIMKLLSFGALFIGSMILFCATNAEVIEWKSVLKNTLLWTATIIGMLSAVLGNYLEKNIRPLFYFKNWVHAEND